MKRLLRILLCLVASFAGLYLTGFGWLMSDMENESQIVWLFLGTSLLFATIFVLLWELYLHSKRENSELTERIDELEAEIRQLKQQEESKSNPQKLI
jgi:cell division protein FtsB